MAENIFLQSQEFSKYNKIFATEEYKHTEHPYVIKRFIMLKCVGLKEQQPIYKEIDATLITYTDGSQNQLLKNWASSQTISLGNSELIKFFEKNYRELDKSFEGIFEMMYESIEASKAILSTVNNKFNESYIENFVKILPAQAHFRPTNVCAKAKNN